MRIIIDTDGNYEGTKVSFNGELCLPPTEKIEELHLSVHPKGKVKMQLTRYNENLKKRDFISMYGGDFAKYDEFNPERRIENEDKGSSVK